MQIKYSTYIPIKININYRQRNTLQHAHKKNDEIKWQEKNYTQVDKNKLHKKTHGNNAVSVIGHVDDAHTVRCKEGCKYPDVKAEPKNTEKNV